MNAHKLITPYLFPTVQVRCCVGAWAFAALCLAAVGVSCDPWDRGAGAMKANQVRSATAMPADAWQADPFAGTTAIEVQHGGETYRIDDSRTVAEVLQAARIAGIDNGVFRGSKPPTRLVFHKTGAPSLRSTLEADGVLGTRKGLIHLEDADGFVKALARHVDAEAGVPVDLLKLEPPAAHLGAVPARPVPASDRSLTAGFEALDLNYHCGPRSLRRARITDPKVLDELHRALKVLKRSPPPPRGTPSSTREFTVHSKDGSYFYADFLDAERFYADSGTYTITPDFVRALNEHLSRIEGRPIDVMSDNPPTAPQRERAKAFVQLLRGVTSVQFIGAEYRVDIDDPSEVKKILAGLENVEAPPREHELPESEIVVELRKTDGRPVRIVFLDTANAPAIAGPLVSDLVRVEGFGQVWVDNQWKYRFQQYRENREWAGREAQQARTVEAVAHDLRSFLPQVISVTVRWREGGESFRTTVLRRRAGNIVAALNVEKVERLDWSRNRWRRELQHLDQRGAGTLTLTPGLGFSLPMAFAGETELLLPPYGRVLLRSSPVSSVAEAVADGDPKSVRLLPE